MRRIARKVSWSEPGVQKINEGLDWAIIGGGLTVVQDVLVLKDSPIKTPAELRGKKFGTFSTGAGSFKSVRVALIDAFKLDVVKDTELQQVAGPALNKLLERGDIDAMMNISSLNLAAEAQTDKFRVLFSTERLLEKENRLSDRLGGAAGRLEKLGRRGSEAGAELRHRRHGIRSCGWPSRKTWKPP